MKSLKSGLSIPKNWQEKYYIKRIGEDDIEITIESRDEILQALNDGARFIQVERYTLMLNSIKSIDPKYGDSNIPPRPTRKLKHLGISKTTGQMVTEDDEERNKLIKQWDDIFGNNHDNKQR